VVASFRQTAWTLNAVAAGADVVKEAAVTSGVSFGYSSVASS
jgi:hypothetical protein